MSISCAPTYLVKESTTTGGTFGTTLVTTVINSVGAVTYTWTSVIESGDGSIGIASPAASSTTVSYNGLSYNGATVNGTVTCTVVDSIGQTAFVNVSVSATRTSGGGVTP